MSHPSQSIHQALSIVDYIKKRFMGQGVKSLKSLTTQTNKLPLHKAVSKKINNVLFVIYM